MKTIYVIGTPPSNAITYTLRRGYRQEAHNSIDLMDDNAARKANKLHLSEESAWRGGSKKKGNRKTYRRS